MLTAVYRCVTAVSSLCHHCVAPVYLAAPNHSFVLMQWRATQHEAALGVLKAVDASVSWEGAISEPPAYLSTFSPYSYPGVRNISSFELTAVDATTVKSYTYESILFGFSLLGTLGTLLLGDSFGNAASSP